MSNNQIKDYLSNPSNGFPRYRIDKEEEFFNDTCYLEHYLDNTEAEFITHITIVFV